MDKSSSTTLKDADEDEQFAPDTEEVGSDGLTPKLRALLEGSGDFVQNSDLR